MAKLPIPAISPDTDPALASPEAMPKIVLPPPSDPGTPPPADMGQPSLPDAATAQPAAPQSDLASVPAGQPIPPEQMGDAAALAGEPSKERHTAQMHEFDARKTANGLMSAALDVNDPDYAKKLLMAEAQHGQILRDEARYKEAHPWGSMESAHPGVFGKIGHAFGEIGNVVGNAVLGPQNMASIPGSAAGLQREEAQGTGQIQEAGKGLEQQAQIGQQEAAASEAPSKVALNTGEAKKAEAEAENVGAPKATSEEPVYDKAGNLIGFQSEGKLVGLHNPELTPGMREMAQTAKAPAPKADEKTPPHITVLGKDGKSHIMERDPATGDYSIDRGEAPPNYAQVAPGMRTVDLISPKTGLPTVTTLTGKELGTAGTGAYGTEMAQAGAVTRGGEALISDLQKHRNDLGTLGAWVQKYGLNTPIADPELARLQAEISTFAALQPAMHGFRSRNALEVFEKIIGGVQKNPEATIGSIRGIMQTAGQINPGLAKQSQTPPKGATQIGRSKVDGKQYYLDAQGKKLGPAE